MLKLPFTGLRLTIRRKLNLLAGFTLVLFAGILYGLVLPIIEQEKRTEREAKLSAVVDTAVSLMHYFENSIRTAGWKRDPSLPKTRKEAQKRVLATLRHQRYDDDEYLFILDGNCNLVLYPLKPELEGDNLCRVETPDGTKPFERMTLNAQKNGAAFVRYIWLSKWSTSVYEPQTTFARHFYPWNWIVCSSVYTQDIEEAVSTITYRISFYIAMIFILVLLVLWLISYKITKPITALSESVGNLTDEIEAGMAKKIEVTSNDEVGDLAASFNRMTIRFQDVMTQLRSEAFARLRLAEIIENTTDLVSFSLPDKNIIYMNRSGRKLLGWDMDTNIEGKPISAIHPQWAFSLIEQRGIPQAIKHGVWQGETALLGADGRETPVSQVIIAHMSPEGKLEYLSTIMRDITHRNRAEKERLHLERQVQQTQKLESLGVLAGGIAHDFNNVLATILANANLALDGLSPHSPARDNIKEIEKATKRASGLARQMLAYSGKGSFVIEPININELVEEMAHLLEVSISKKTSIQYNFAEDIPSFNGDATQIRQIIMNLITNASEAIGDKNGAISLSTDVMHCDRNYLDSINAVVRAGLDTSIAEGNYVYLEVTDTGCGITEETENKIFDPFFTTKFTGRGLGMSAVLGIIRGHKGVIKIYSEEGKGTTIRVLFPVVKSEVSTFTRKSTDTEAENWRGTGTALIADDEEMLCIAGKHMLERIGFTVLTASDGREAIETFRDHADEIVFVLLDLTMPYLDGAEVFRKMRRIRPDIKVILCSGYDEQDATQRFIGSGLAGFIQKPYTLTILRDTLKEIFDR